MRIVPLLFLLPSLASAEIVYVDINDSPHERQAIRDVAENTGQRGVLVRPVSNGDLHSKLEGVLARAERGEITMSTLVISGHSTGGNVYGEQANDAPSLSAIELAALKKKYPKAFSQVRHVVFAACSIGRPHNSLAYEPIFPNIITFSGFNGGGPADKRAASYLRAVLGAIDRERKKAGGDEALARKLDDKQAREQFVRVLECLTAVSNTNYSFRVCGDFHDAGNVDTSDFLAIEALRKLVEPCVTAQEPCLDPFDRRHDVFAMNHAYIARPRKFDDPFVAQVRALAAYPEVERRWAEENDAILRLAAPSLLKAGLPAPNGEQFRGWNRRQQLDFAARVRGAVKQVPSDSRHLVQELDDELMKIRKLETIPTEWLEET